MGALREIGIAAALAVLPYFVCHRDKILALSHLILCVSFVMLLCSDEEDTRR